MTSRMDEFRTFVQKYSKVREDVKNGTRTWQDIYEEWVLYGEDDPIWKKYLTAEETAEPSKTPEKKGILDSFGNVKKVLTQIQKVNPDKLNNTLNSVQKVIQIAQSVTGTKAAAAAPLFTSAYSDWWD